MAPSRKPSDKWIKVSAWCCEKQIQLLSSVIGDQFNKVCSARMSAVMQGLKRMFTKKEVKPYMFLTSVKLFCLLLKARSPCL